MIAGNGTGPKDIRAAQIGDLQEIIKKSSGMIFVDYRGLDSVGMYELRKSLRPTGVRFKIVKNTLMRLACEREKVAGVDEWLVFNTAVAFTGEDPVSVLKILSDFTKSNEHVKLKGGVIDGAPVGLKDLKALAALPNRREMLTHAAGAMKGILSRGARDFSWLLTRLAMDMRAHTKSMGKA
jgi:large subunit ribosomal protein L10